jgi:hypothetical protein
MLYKFFLYNENDGVIFFGADCKPDNSDFLVTKKIFTYGIKRMDGINVENIGVYFNSTGIEIAQELTNEDIFTYNPTTNEITRVGSTDTFALPLNQWSPGENSESNNIIDLVINNKDAVLTVVDNITNLSEAKDFLKKIVHAIYYLANRLK